MNTLMNRGPASSVQTPASNQNRGWASQFMAWVEHQQRERVSRKMALLTLDHPSLAREIAAISAHRTIADKG